LLIHASVPRGNAAGSSRIASSPTFPKIELTRLRSGTPEAGYLVGNISQIYSPELLVGRTPVCCFDHQSFVPFGFPATNLFEHNGPILDPMYHDVGDVSQRENYDFGQIVSIAKVTMATVLTVAGYRIAE